MLACKHCQQQTTVKNGLIRNKPRYTCQACGDNCVRGDARHKRTTELKKALGLILYSLGTASFGFSANRFGVSRTTVYYRIRQAAAMTDEPAIDADIQELEFDEMWHSIQSQQDKSGLLKP